MLGVNDHKELPTFESELAVVINDPAKLKNLLEKTFSRNGQKLVYELVIMLYGFNPDIFFRTLLPGSDSEQIEAARGKLLEAAQEFDPADVEELLSGLAALAGLLSDNKSGYLTSGVEGLDTLTMKSNILSLIQYINAKNWGYLDSQVFQTMLKSAQIMRGQLCAILLAAEDASVSQDDTFALPHLIELPLATPASES